MKNIHSNRHQFLIQTYRNTIDKHKLALAANRYDHPHDKETIRLLEIKIKSLLTDPNNHKAPFETWSFFG